MNIQPPSRHLYFLVGQYERERGTSIRFNPVRLFTGIAIEKGTGKIERMCGTMLGVFFTGLRLIPRLLCWMHDSLLVGTVGRKMMLGAQ
jgi:hypothetical protein